MKNTANTPAKNRLRAALRHPFAGFLAIGVFLILLQVMAMINGGSWPKSSVLNGFATVLIYSIVGFGFTYLLGYAGLASLGTAGFVGLGAYLTGFILKNYTQVPYVAIILLTLLISLVLGLIVGFISLRIEGIFLAIVTLGLSEIFYQIFNNWIDFTNGPNGASITKTPIFQTLLDMGSTDARRWFFILLVVITVFLMMLTHNLGKSSTGRAMLAMKNSTSAAQAMGISLLKYRLLAFLLSTVYAGLAGVLFMSYFKYSAPQNYTIMFSLNILAAVLIGGSRNLIGTLVGSFIVFGITPIFLQDIAFFRENPWLINVLIGVIIILIIMFYPGGLVQIVATLKAKARALWARSKGAAPADLALKAQAEGQEAVISSETQLKENSQKRALLAASLKESAWAPNAGRDVKVRSGSQSLPEDICLRLENLSMTFGGLKAVDGLSFDVRQGEIFGLIGPNGAGKTTVFNCITQFYKPTAGGILFRTRGGQVINLNDYQVHDIIDKGIVRTFQNVEVIGELTILENLLIASHPQFRGNLFQQMFRTPKVRKEEEALRDRAIKVLEYCGLAQLKDLPPVGQPYGILKRIELARTLMADASLIILDEPAAGLNEQETMELTQLIHDIQRDFGVTIFLVEHDMGLVMDICDHICAISFGKKLAYGTPREIQNDPVVQEAYLGTKEDSKEAQDVQHA
ncbi:MAG: ATP-binding cassette domain-containing protein [Clostridiales bacterium]|nr:ATP-binding cassette domain-containing protein [Clostridiales bacterium]